MLKIIILIIITYFIGTISSARIIARIKDIDLKNRGTQNPGATNVYKLAGPFWGIFTGTVDFFKGFIPVYITKELLKYNWQIIILVAIVVIAGHNWPLQYGFKGGRGLATSLGTLGAVSFTLGLISFILGSLLVLILRKYSDRDWRIPFFVYPIFFILTVNFNYDINLIIYTLAILILAVIRGWQVRER